MKKIVFIFVISLLCTITLTAQNLYIYKTDGTVYGKQTTTIDSINFSMAQDSFYVHHLDTIKRYACTEVDSLSFTTPTNTTDAGVVINGVKWATRNVATPGTFAIAAEDAGMFYQWNSNVGWPSTGDIGSITATDGTKTWNSSWEGGYINPSSTDTWTSTNDPSPQGWRIPTSAEIQSLVNTTYVTHTWTTQNGVNGEKFTDKTSGNTLFLPASGYRYSDDGSIGSAGSYGGYWSSTANGGGSAYSLFFHSGNAGWGYSSRAFSFTVRPVAE